MRMIKAIAALLLSVMFLGGSVFSSESASSQTVRSPAPVASGTPIKPVSRLPFAGATAASGLAHIKRCTAHGFCATFPAIRTKSYENGERFNFDGKRAKIYRTEVNSVNLKGTRWYCELGDCPDVRKTYESYQIFAWERSYDAESVFRDAQIDCEEPPTDTAVISIAHRPAQYFRCVNMGGTLHAAVVKIKGRLYTLYQQVPPGAAGSFFLGFYLK